MTQALSVLKAPWLREAYAALRRIEQGEARLERQLGLHPDRIYAAAPANAGGAVRVTFGDGRTCHLRKEDIRGLGGGRVSSARPDLDGAEVVVRSPSGREVRLPWDYVRYACDPDYAALVDRDRDPLATRRIAERLRFLRKQRGLDPATVARRSGLARPNVHRLERGLHRPQMETLVRLARALGVTLADIVRK